MFVTFVRGNAHFVTASLYPESRYIYARIANTVRPLNGVSFVGLYTPRIPHITALNA